MLTILDRYTLTPAGGLVVYDFPLGDEFECDVSAGLGYPADRAGQRRLPGPSSTSNASDAPGRGGGDRSSAWRS